MNAQERQNVIQNLKREHPDAKIVFIGENEVAIRRYVPKADLIRNITPLEAPAIFGAEVKNESNGPDKEKSADKPLMPPKMF